MNRLRKIERVAAYVRVSHQEQKLHGLSLDAQRMKLLAYAKKNDMKIVGWYVDEGVSGRKLIRKRPELQRMIQDAEKGEFDRIIFIKLDRFFRSVAEYHECMKRIAPVLWTTTEEEYDLSTANGRMLVNMKLTIAEMEADQGGERIKIVNEYKVSTGQPLFGKRCMPFGFNVGWDEEMKRKNVIKDPDEKHILEDAIQHYLTHQSKRKTIVYMYNKYHVSMDHKTLTGLLENPMLKGQYRDNPNYCEAYVDSETFDRIQEISKRNLKGNTAPNRAYLFSGIAKCPVCGKSLVGSMTHTKGGRSSGKIYRYKRYKCQKHASNMTCTFKKGVFENTIENVLLENIEQYLEEVKVKSAQVVESNEDKVYEYNVEDIHAEIDRLNYSWRKGKIRTAEQYEEQYDELMEKLKLAESERTSTVPKDFSKVEAILQKGWKDIYRKLDDEHKRAFWRSFIASFDVEWRDGKREIKNILFF